MTKTNKHYENQSQNPCRCADGERCTCSTSCSCKTCACGKRCGK